jgi:hypothetical protein
VRPGLPGMCWSANRFCELVGVLGAFGVHSEHSTLVPLRLFALGIVRGLIRQISISPVQRLSRAAVTTPSDGVFIDQWFVTMIAAAINTAPAAIAMLCPMV